MSDAESLLARWFAAGDAGQVDAFDRYLQPGVVVHAPMGLSTVGIEDEGEVWRAATSAMPDLRHEIQEVVVTGSTVAARSVVTGTLRGTFAGVTANGRRFQIDQAVFAHLRDGKAAEVWEIADTASLMRQLGAIP